MTTSSISVLLVEDDPDCASLFRRMLTFANSSVVFNPEWADRLSTGLERLSGGNFDAVLPDLTLPDSHGVETLSRVRAQAPMYRSWCSPG
jgi:DNA-binding response OmpR family regulator